MSKFIDNIEIRIYPDKTGNLNFWNNTTGNDVIADIDESNNLSIKGKLITFSEYLNLVKKSLKGENE